IANQNPLNLFSLIDVALEAFCNDYKISLSTGDLGFLGVTVHGSQVACKSRQLVVPNQLPFNRPFNLLEILKHIDIQSSAGCYRLLHSLVKGGKALIAEHGHQVARVPKSHAILLAQAIEVRLALVKMEDVCLGHGEG